jgi:hypothetical protein
MVEAGVDFPVEEEVEAVSVVLEEAALAVVVQEEAGSR